MKSANIFLYRDMQAKLGDLNVSKIVKKGLSYTQTGTPYYASPEVWRDMPYYSKSDIWSLGCILAELYTGYVLFQNDSVQGLLSRVIGIIGPVPEYMMKEGKLVSNFFTREGLIYMEAPDDEEES